MRHLKLRRKLNLNSAHRKSMLHNMAVSLFKYKMIKTTYVRAKELQKLIDYIITKAKNKSVHNQRIIFKILKDKTMMKNLLSDLFIRYTKINGGYTRILKYGFRKGDGSPIVIIKFK